MPIKDKSSFLLNTVVFCQWEVWMTISIILLLFVTLWGHDPRVTTISRKKERRKGGKTIENYAIEPSSCLSWSCWPKLAQTLCCGSSAWKQVAQSSAMANVILIVLCVPAQPSSHISLHHVSPSGMICPWSSEYIGSSFAQVLPVWCTTHGSWCESVLYMCRSRKGLTWKLQAVSGYRFGGGISQGSSLDLNEITCDRCSLEFFPKIWWTVI